MDRWTDQIHKFWKKVLEDKVTRDCEGAQARKINMLLSFCGCSKYLSPRLSTFKCNKTIPKHIVYWWEPGSYPKTFTIAFFLWKKFQHVFVEILYLLGTFLLRVLRPLHVPMTRSLRLLHPISQAISVPVVTWRWDRWTRASSGFHWTVWGCLVEGFSWTNSNED